MAKMIILSVLLFVGLVSTQEEPKTNLIGGKFSFSHQENFTEYLQAAGVAPEKVQLLSSLKPDALVENHGDDTFSISLIVAPNKNKTTTFTLGKEYETDFLGTGVSVKTLTTIVNDNTFNTFEVENPDSKRFGEFTETQMIMTLDGYGVVSKRYFDRTN